MRIANRSLASKGLSGKSLLALLAAWGGLSCLAMPGYAADAIAPAPTPAAAVTADAPAAAPAKESDTIEKKMTAMEDKVVSGVKGTIKNLDSSEGMSLADLNSAKQTVARIDAMIEIEKRMIELEKLRNERGGTRPFVGGGFAGAIPASALAPLPQVSKPVFADTETAKEAQRAVYIPTEAPHYEILRIAGAAGRYSAVLKTPNGDRKTVQPGDKIAGGTVGMITASTVMIESKDKTTSLHIKNADLVSTVRR